MPTRTSPAAAPVTDVSGFEPNVEAITEFEPDLVIIFNDANELVAGLSAAGIPVLVSPALLTSNLGTRPWPNLA